VTALAAAAAIAVVVAVTPSAAQQTPVIEGTVLLLDGADVVVDVGKARGIVDGDVVELWRPMKVKHPVTGKVLVDRFKIGELRIAQARDVLSLARPVGALLRPVQAGDVVTIAGKTPVPSTPATTTPTVAKPVSSAKASPAPAVAASGSIAVAVPGASAQIGFGTEPCKPEDEEAKELSILFDDLSGASPETRASRYEAWIKTHPYSRFERVLREEAAALRAKATAGPEKAADTIEVLSQKSPTELVRGHAASIGLELLGPVAGVVLYTALPDEAAFQPIVMRSAGARYWTATIPEDRVQGTKIRWFVQAVLPSGKSLFIVGDASSPRETTVVDAPKTEAPPPHEAIASLWLDYADFNRLSGNDWAVQSEGYFGLRIDDVGLRAVRSGLGIFRGQGGSIQELDVQNLKPRGVGLTYGYLEAEWGLTHFWGLVTRAVIGLGENGLNGGGQVFVRIGNDKETNLLLGGEFLGGIGVRGITQVELKTLPGFPIMLRTEVTNQPAGTSVGSGDLAGLEKDNKATGTTDLGVRGIAQFGYQQTKNVLWFLRVSAQGRNINHFGPGAGMGVALTW
jgi:hypothetical protein